MTLTAASDAGIALSLQRALLGAITAKLRTVAFRLEANQLTVTFVFDGAPDDDDIDAAQVAVTEVVSDFPSGLEIEAAIMRRDFPSPLPRSDLGRLVYLRREPVT